MLKVRDQNSHTRTVVIVRRGAYERKLFILIGNSLGRSTNFQIWGFSKMNQNQKFLITDLSLKMYFKPSHLKIIIKNTNPTTAIIIIINLPGFGVSEITSNKKSLKRQFQKNKKYSMFKAKFKCQSNYYKNFRFVFFHFFLLRILN